MYPSSIPATTFEREFTESLKEGIEEHGKWFKLNIWALPITLVLFIVPGTLNIPLYWNAYRLYCHWKAKLAGNYLLAHVENNPILPHGDLARSPIIFTPCKKLDAVYSMSKDRPLDVSTLDKIPIIFQNDAELQKYLHFHLSFISHPPSWSPTADELNAFSSGFKSKFAKKQ